MRQSPMRTISPSGFCSWNSSRATFDPSTTTGDRERRERRGLRQRAQQRFRVVERQVVGHAAEAGHRAGRLVAAGEDDQQVGADLGELADDVAPRSLAERGQHDHRGDADRHAEQREHRAAPVAQQRPAGEARDRLGLHAGALRPASSSPRSVISAPLTR
jgi:hypothetical protein